MKLERHVGGLSLARKEKYLTASRWLKAGPLWQSPLPEAEPVPLAKALHHQLTADLTQALGATGWKVVDYSDRGYARLSDPKDRSTCSLPAALRRQARREGKPVAELTYVFFLAALLRAEESHQPS